MEVNRARFRTNRVQEKMKLCVVYLCICVSKQDVGGGRKGVDKSVQGVQLTNAKTRRVIDASREFTVLKTENETRTRDHKIPAIVRKREGLIVNGTSAYEWEIIRR